MTTKKRTSGLKLALKTSVVSGMTLISRILGLVRDIVFARYFGASLVMDAFLVAQRIPNMLRRFFAEGAFSAGFIPVMARYREKHDHEEAREFVDAVAGTFGIVLFLVTLLGVIASPLLVLIVAPGFIGDGGDFDLAALMLRFTFPYLLFVSLTAFAGGVLNTYGRFGVPAFTPVILNVVLIVAAIWVAPMLEQPVMALAYAILVAGILQLLFQLPFLARIRAFPRPIWAPRHDGVRRAFRLMVPAVFGSSVAQINVLIGGVIASLLPVGSISYLYFSDRLMEFPLGLFSIALATVTLPTLSRLWASDDKTEFSQTLDWSMRLAMLIVLPAAAGLVVLAGPLITTLFYGGIFDEKSVGMTRLALQAYALGLIGFSFVKILAPAFFAREDTRTPVLFGLVALGVNFVLSIASAWYLTSVDFAGPHVGLAGATSVAAILNAALLYRGLHKDDVIQHSTGWLLLMVRVIAANIAMCAVLLLLYRPPEWWLGVGSFDRVYWLGVSVVAGAAAYFVSLLILGLRPSQFRFRVN
ncbi:MAG: murein biosynthesis integral membrane protein MurJ [Gammaproteobacteria bacterium]|nr:murein biosynthesis integral membrane protein MurJ [Gammaproteobacteria bacterium]MBT8110131.1 murein biosynthesis integral membrane protein MurJ [Gammaproteobacteria bacterium]NND47697.1 murein biosynthesis integral membrane protein MurJ [Woeseiaceae bacterium]NNL44835.1 murein biosynthesis integral membrane protein MurJ [Woeseiaceae bacterium]